MAKWVFVYTNKKALGDRKGRESKIKKLKIERRKERGKRWAGKDEERERKLGEGDL